MPLRLCLYLLASLCLIPNSLWAETKIHINPETFAQNCQKGTLKVIKTAIKNGADPLAILETGLTPLETALTRDDHDSLAITQFFIDSGAEVNLPGYLSQTPLLMASMASKTRLKKTTMLLLAGARVNLGNNQNQTALHMALQEESCLKLIQTLLEAGADPNLSDLNGYTPLMYGLLLSPAPLETRLAFVDLLLAKGANLNLATPKGTTALMISAVTREPEMVNRLVALGADPQATDHEGLTALMLAAKNGRYPQTLSALIGLGLSPTQKNKKGQSAQDLSKLNHSAQADEIRAILKVKDN